MGTIYDRGIFRQNQELTQRCEKQERELAQMRLLLKEVVILRERVSKLETRVIELEAENATLRTENVKQRELITKQQELIAKQTDEISRLKSQIGKDSSNSGKPPSSDGYRRIPNNREKSGKKQGGQEGHKGKTLIIPENLDELVAQGKAEHVIINEVAPGEAYVSDWVVDIKIITVYTETRRATGKPQRIAYGSGIGVATVYLAVVGLIAVKRLSEYFRDVTGGLITMAKATIQKIASDMARKVDTKPLVNDLLNGTVLNVDETPVKTTQRVSIDGKVETSSRTTLLAYVRTYSNERTTVLTANAHKNMEGVKSDNILNRYCGVVVQDYEAKFLCFGTETALCAAHLTRELKGYAELDKVLWADQFRAFMLEMNARKNIDISAGKTSCEPELLRKFEIRYDKLVSQGQAYLATLEPNSYAWKTIAPMIKRLSQRKAEYMLFMRNYPVPFTNNLAERDLRHCKTKQKISGCYRSWLGLTDYCKLRSVIETARKRGDSIFECLYALSGLPLPAGQ